jgi:hypothetical protein
LATANKTSSGQKGKIKQINRTVSDDMELLRMIIVESGPLRTVVLDKLKQAKSRIDKQGSGGAVSANGGKK